MPYESEPNCSTKAVDRCGRTSWPNSAPATSARRQPTTTRSRSLFNSTTPPKNWPTPRSRRADDSIPQDPDSQPAPNRESPVERQTAQIRHVRERRRTPDRAFCCSEAPSALADRCARLRALDVADRSRVYGWDRCLSFLDILFTHCWSALSIACGVLCPDRPPTCGSTGSCRPVERR